MKILLTGGSGQVGREILKSKPGEIHIISPNRNELDLSNYNECKNFVKENKPDWIINCGAYTSVDGAEKDIELSSKINSFAPKAFAEVINEINGNLLQKLIWASFARTIRVPNEFRDFVVQYAFTIVMFGDSKTI